MRDYKLIFNKRIGGGSVTNASCNIPLKESDTVDEYHDCVVEKNRKFHPASGVTSCSNVLKNTSQSNIMLSMISSLFVENIAPDFHNRNVVIHICNSSWQGEAQWVSYTPYEMGLYPISAHDWTWTEQTVSNTGTWTTSKKYPIVMIEDKDAGKVWFFEIQSGSSWQFEFGVTKNNDVFFMTLDCTACNENLDGFYKVLKPFERFETPTVLYGIADSMEDAAGRLITYKRENDRRFNRIPVCFNDYMNCLWGMPSHERLIPLIDKAADAGIEIFCIDAGWFIVDQVEGSFGDYVENDAIFGEDGLKGILNYIISKGMKPGLWFELETAFENARIVKLSSDAVLQRGGEPIRNPLDNKKLFLNFTCKEVREHLHARIRHFYDMGLRFIKNDYNQTVGIGCDTREDMSASAALMEHTQAFYSFVEELYIDMPELIVENCGSGAMRCDNETLRHFWMQSTSDQENFLNNPSIIRGLQGFMPPEKMGIWSCPYPVLFDQRYEAEKLFDDEYKSSMNDGEQTVWNMALTLFGIIYLSGFISECDEYNFSLIKRAVELYKADRKFVREALPVFIGRQQHLYSEGYSVLALKNDSKIKIGIFRNGGEDMIEFSVPQEFIGGTIKEVYPCKDESRRAVLKDEMLCFQTDKKLCAVVYEINKA